MKKYLVFFLIIIGLLSACTPDPVEPPTSAPDPAVTLAPTGTVILPSPTADLSPISYTDPAGQFRLSLPAGWQPGEEQGLFRGPDGLLQLGYLPEMAFMNSVNRVCERLANTPGGPARKIDISPLPTADACTLTPYPEMSTDRVKLVVANPSGEPEQRYFYLESDSGHLAEISASLELLNPPSAQEAFPYPAGAVRPEDESFWAGVGAQPGELTVEEYAVVDATIDSPTHSEFLERIPKEVLGKRAGERENFRERRLANNNALLEPFGYSLEAKQETEMELYALYQEDELLLDEISMFWPVSINASKNDFAMVVEVWNNGTLIVRKDNLAEWDMGASLFIQPVFYGDELLHVVWDFERSQVQIMRGQEQIYAFAALFLVDMPLKAMGSWDDRWLLEVDGFLIQDGEILNESLGYEEIFGWQLLNEKPFYYFRKGPRVGVSYDGSTLPVYYDEIIHYRCCEPSMFNNAGNEDMVWFYGLRDGTWYYVEIGAFEE
jgi:hypothetical protein